MLSIFDTYVLFVCRRSQVATFMTIVHTGLRCFFAETRTEGTALNIWFYPVQENISKQIKRIALVMRV